MLLPTIKMFYLFYLQYFHFMIHPRNSDMFIYLSFEQWNMKEGLESIVLLCGSYLCLVFNIEDHNDSSLVPVFHLAWRLLSSTIAFGMKEGEGRSAGMSSLMWPWANNTCAKQVLQNKRIFIRRCIRSFILVSSAPLYKIYFCSVRTSLNSWLLGIKPQN